MGRSDKAIERRKLKKKAYAKEKRMSTLVLVNKLKEENKERQNENDKILEENRKIITERNEIIIEI